MSHGASMKGLFGLSKLSSPVPIHKNLAGSNKSLLKLHTFDRVILDSVMLLMSEKLD
jgi:hypothetical protein